MLVTFEEEYLRELYVDGKSSNKKHRYQPDIIRRYQKGIRALISAESKEALYVHRALHFEALRGDRNGQFSIKVNDQYRIIFTMRETSEDPIVTICNIEELSNHYD